LKNSLLVSYDLACFSFMGDSLSVFMEKELLWNLNRLDLLLEVLLIMLLDNLRTLIFFWTPLGLKISESKLFSYRVRSILRLGLKRGDKNKKIKRWLGVIESISFADYLRETDSDSILVGLFSICNGRF